MKNINTDILNHYENDVSNLLNHFTGCEQKTQHVMKNLKYYVENESAIVGGHIKNKQLVSFIWSHKRDFNGETRLHIKYFIVDKLYRGNGLSKELITFVKKSAIERKISKIDLNVEPDNNKAIEMYQKAGFITERVQLIMNINEVDKNV